MTSTAWQTSTDVSQATPSRAIDAGPLPAKAVSASRVTLAQLMGPTEANVHGNVHGGHVMKLMDEAGASAAMRHAHSQVVTVAVDQVLFLEPIHLGDLVTLHAELTYVGRTSIEVRLEVHATDLITGTQTHTNTAYFVYVALDRQGRPAPVPPLLLETASEHSQWEAAQARQRYRLKQREARKQAE
jgi:acyl-CoA hydrolase